MNRVVASLSVLVAIFVCVGPASAQRVIKRKKINIELDWKTLESKKHFTIQYESVIAPEFVERVARELEEILTQYVKVFRVPPKKGERFQVKFLNNGNTYLQVGGDPGHPGFYNPGDKTLVLLQRPFYDLIPTVYHEAFHQYLHHYLGDDVPMPTWFNEGMATYYEGMQRDTHTRAKALNSKKIDTRKIRMVKDAIFTRTQIPLEKLVDATHAEFHDKEQEALHYHQSFAVVYFLMQATKGRSAMDFVRTLKKTKSVEQANAKIFGKDRRNLKRVEASWKKFVLDLDPEKPGK